MSAIVLVTIALSATYAGNWSFVALVAAAAIVMSWEWSAMTCRAHKDLGFFALAGVALTAAFIAGARWPVAAFGVVAAAALLAGLLAARFDRLIWIAAGALFIGLPVVALIWLRHLPGYGWWSVCFVFAVVWATDSAAYATGRILGGAKLSPHLSPNKTWSGFFGGLLAANLVGMAFALAPVPGSTLSLVFLASALSVAAQMGDLTESAIKRKFETKDAGSLIPGHGGLLDRVDGLAFAVLAAAGLALLAASGAQGQGIFF
jgi:phosphatidate cytidylyltransferase